MAKRRSLHTTGAAFRGEWSKIAEQMEERIKYFLSKGVPIREAVSRAMLDTGVSDRLKGAILDDIGEAYVAGRGTLVVGAFGKSKASRQWWLNRHWDGDALTLSKRIAKVSNGKMISSEISRQMKLANDWKKTAKALTDQKLIKADVAGHMWDTISAARKALRDPAAAAEYAQVVRKSQREIERLAKAGAPTERLKKAYQSVITATEKGSAEALEKAVGRAVKAKARYNAERISRTERSRAYNEGVLGRIDAGEDADIISAVRFSLSSRHPVDDICDYYSSVDEYGLGPGIWPKSAVPVPPVHPHCMCMLSPVYGHEKAAKRDTKAGMEWMKKNPAVARHELGIQGAKDIKAGWEKNARNTVDMRPAKSQVPDGIE